MKCAIWTGTAFHKRVSSALRVLITHSLQTITRIAVSICVGVRVDIMRAGLGSGVQRISRHHQGGGFCLSLGRFCLVRPTAACTGDAAAAI